MNFFKEKGKGLLLCLSIATLVWITIRLIHSLEIIGAPIIAILIGMIFGGILKNKSTFQSGIAFTSKKILQYAIILLGFGLNLRTVGRVGSVSLPIILSTIAISLIVAFILYKTLKVPAKTSILIGVGSSICGGSAIAATAPVIQANDQEIAGSISVIFFFNVIAALLFPVLGTSLGLSNDGFGLFAGTAVNDMSSVAAAASTWDTVHDTNGRVLAYATIVKLTRTLAIIPITLGLAFFQFRKAPRSHSKAGTAASIQQIFPMFILYFILASLFTTLITGLGSGNVQSAATIAFAHLNQLSKFLIVMAMSAIGFNTNIVKLVNNGGRLIVMGFCCWVSISLVSLFLQKLLRIF